VKGFAADMQATSVWKASVRTTCGAPPLADGASVKFDFSAQIRAHAAGSDLTRKAIQFIPFRPRCENH
jgi:hypothetical protein